MVAGGLPTLTVLLDDGSGSFPYDITAYARMQEGYTGNRGRADELSTVEAGNLGLSLDNTDGRFTVGSTIIASPSPIKLDARIRVKVTPTGGTAVTRFTQHVQNWPTEWPSGSDLFSVVGITATDAQAKAERRTLRSVIEEEILLRNPTAYYTLGAAAGATAVVDSSGNQGPNLIAAGTGTAVAFGTDDGTGIGGTVATFSGGQYLAPGSLVGSFAGIGVRFTGTTLAPGPSGQLVVLATDKTVVGVRADGRLQVTGRVIGGVYVSSATAIVTDGSPHTVFVTSDGTTDRVYHDGALVSSWTLAGLPAWFSVGGVSAGDLLASGFTWDTGNMHPYNGQESHVPIYGSLPSGGDVSAISQAMLTGFAGESGTARTTRTAGYANLPIGTLDASLTNVAFVDITGKSAGEALRDVADAEGGLVFVDGSGNLTFHNRNRAVNKTTPDVTIDANFLAEGTRFEYDMQGVLNYLEVTAAGTGVPQVVRNVVSEVTNAHGRYPDSRTYLVQTDQEALDRANWLVSTHAEPAPRVGSLAFDVLTMTAAQQQQMLTLEPDSWLRVTGLPGQTPGGTTANFVVEGFADALNLADWTMTFNAANRAVAAPNVWVLDDATRSVLDSTTRLFY